MLSLIDKKNGTQLYIHAWKMHAAFCWNAIKTEPATGPNSGLCINISWAAESLICCSRKCDQGQRYKNQEIKERKKYTKRTEMRKFCRSFNATINIRAHCFIILYLVRIIIISYPSLSNFYEHLVYFTQKYFTIFFILTK